MSDKKKVKNAMTEAILKALWVRGFISDKEQREMEKRMRRKNESGTC